MPSEESADVVAHSQGDRIVAKYGPDDVDIVEGDWRTMKELAQALLTEVEDHETDFEKAKNTAPGVHVRMYCDDCGIDVEEEYARHLPETPEEHVDHPDYDCSLEDVTIEAFCPRHGTVSLDYYECDTCASTRAVMNR